MTQRCAPNRRRLTAGLLLTSAGLLAGCSAIPAERDVSAAWPTPGELVPAADFQGPGSLSTVMQWNPRTAAARRIDVWLPPQDGAAATAGHPLLIMHDGQNLFEPRHAMGGETWQMAQAAMRLPAARRPVILGVWNTPARRREYLPTAMERQLPEDLRERIGTANGGPPLSDGYLAFLAEALIPWARAALPVSRQRADTLVMGSSMGGLISLAALCRYPQLFGGAGCLSIHWPLLTDAAAYERGDLQTDRVLAALDRFMSETMLRPGGGHRLFLDRGTEGRDALYPPYQAAMDQRLAGLGWTEQTGLRSLVIDGSGHNEASWRTRVDAALSWLLVKDH